MDEAGFITPDTAIAKAFTVAAFRSMSPRFPDGLVIQQWFKRAQSAIARQLGRHDQWADCRKRRVRAHLQGRRNGWSLWNFRRDFATGRGDSDLCARGKVRWAHAPEHDTTDPEVKAHINALYAKAGIVDRNL